MANCPVCGILILEKTSNLDEEFVRSERCQEDWEALSLEERIRFAECERLYNASRPN
ncbi:MAG: hypothetical protein WAV50_00110 [Minisyncoccia bacterium]